MVDLQEYRIQIHLEINTYIFIPREAKVFSPLMCLYSSMCDHCSGGWCTAGFQNIIKSWEMSSQGHCPQWVSVIGSPPLKRILFQQTL